MVQSTSQRAAVSFSAAFSSSQQAPTRVESVVDGSSFVPLMMITDDYGVSDEASSSSSSSSAVVVDLVHAGDSGGSTVRAAIFNFTNSIIGAGAIGLGGAFAVSGGCISIVSILLCAYLTKVSLDLVLELSLHQGVTSYEELGSCGYGRTGQLCVTWCKLLYSFGCLVAYVIVIKDNLGPALISLIYGNEETPSPFIFDQLFHNSNLLTFLVSFLVILPLCLLRDMTPLANFSLVSVLGMVMIVMIVVYLYLFPPIDEHHQDKDTSVYEDWFEIRWNGYLQSLGTFVFTFVSQHMVHMAYASLKPELRTLGHWKQVSSWSLSLASVVSLSVGLFAYMTFWQAQGSDIFEMYPNLAVISIAKLLLCGTMLLTFPLPFFTCRELIVLLGTKSSVCPSHSLGSTDPIAPSATSLDMENCALEEPLLLPSSESDDEASLLPWLLEENQLQLVYHVSLTLILWLVTTCLAIVAPNLGDILAIVGCATGSAIAFVLPSLLSLKLQGYNHQALVLLVVGVAVLFVGTFYSGKKLIQDVYRLV